MKLADIETMRRVQAEFEQIARFEKGIKDNPSGGATRIEITVEDTNGIKYTFVQGRPQSYSLSFLRKDLAILAEKYRKEAQAKLVLYGVDDFSGWLPKGESM